MHKRYRGDYRGFCQDITGMSDTFLYHQYYAIWEGLKFCRFTRLRISIIEQTTWQQRRKTCLSMPPRVHFYVKLHFYLFLSNLQVVLLSSRKKSRFHSPNFSIVHARGQDMGQNFLHIIQLMNKASQLGLKMGSKKTN